MNNYILDYTIPGIVGGVAILVGHPFDTIKVRMQTGSKYKGCLDCFNNIIKYEGIRGLYSGIIPPLIGQSIFRSSVFFTNYYIKDYFYNYNKKELNPYHYFIAGGISWGVGTIFECPFDIIKTNKQLGNIYNFNIKNLYNGFNIHLLRNILGGSIQLGIFDNSRIYLSKYKNINVDNLSLFNNIILGGISGVIFWSIIYPIDVIKSNIQANNNKFNIKYLNYIYKQNGLSYFYRGYIPCIYRAFIGNSIMLCSIVKIREIIFNKKNY